MSASRQPKRKVSVMPEKEEYINFLVFIVLLLAVLTVYGMIWKVVF